jgi:multidrug resistance protein
MLLAPLSEYFGRNPVYFCSWFILFIFQLPLALAPNIATVIVCRLIQGFGGSAPLTNTGGTVSDVWERNSSGPAMSIYGLSSTFGPPIALVISGYIAQEMGWRWLFWVYMAIFGGVWLIMMVSSRGIPQRQQKLIQLTGNSPRNPPQHHSGEESLPCAQNTHKGGIRKLGQTRL